MVTGGVETILGVQRDPVFGPIVMFGLGGLFVEALKDVTFRAAPFDEIEARAMIESNRRLPRPRPDSAASPPRTSTRSRRPLSRLSRFAAANDRADTIESLDVNPFLVRPEGALSPSTRSSSPAPPERRSGARTGLRGGVNPEVVQHLPAVRPVPRRPEARRR